MTELENSGWVLANHPATIAKKLAAQFEGDWAGWEPETILRSLPELVDSISKDKVLAVHAVIGNSARACSLAVAFENIVHPFCNSAMLTDVAQPAEIPEIAYAVEQMREIIRMAHGEDAVFIGEIPGYVAATAKYRGVLVLPKMLSFAQQSLNFANGIKESSAKQVAFSAMLKKANSLVEKLSKVDFKSTSGEGVDLSMLDDLETNFPADLVPTVRTLVGSYLYDPTSDVLSG